ncbi:MAG TPA: hypothetical protein VGM44_15225, partial [Polyangiaceae bacterium]
LPAQAQDASTAGHASAGLLVGDGFKDGFNLGFGLRAGYTLPMNVYVGGTFVYHLGKSQDQAIPSFDPNTGNITTTTISAKLNVYYVGAEGGYDIDAGPVVIRPYLGLGYATATASITGFPSVSQSKFAFWPGATLLYPLGGAFIGADARFVFISGATDENGDAYNAFSLFATAGMQF